MNTPVGSFVDYIDRWAIVRLPDGELALMGNDRNDGKRKVQLIDGSEQWLPLSDSLIVIAWPHDICFKRLQELSEGEP